MLFESGWIIAEEDRNYVSNILDMDTKDLSVWWAINREQHVFLFTKENDINDDYIKCGFFFENGITNIEVARVIDKEEYGDEIRVHYYINKIKYPLGVYNEEEIKFINETLKDILLEMRFFCKDSYNIIEETVKFDVDEEFEEEKADKKKIDSMLFKGWIFVFIIGNIIYEMQIQNGANRSRTLYYSVHFIALSIYGIFFYTVIGILKIVGNIMRRNK